mmetsp:Transcript_5858/g.24486  ORF Transcript_5858/g.24486 Transcript_5858/m.24486 type:complete len:498 (+) Transcript_5858:654-2147(+)
MAIRCGGLLARTTAVRSARTVPVERVEDVALDRPREEHRVLADERHSPVQRGVRHVRDVLAVDPNGPGVGRVESLHKRQHRRFARPRRAHERDDGPGRHGERHASEHGHVGPRGILEMHVLELNAAERRRRPDTTRTGRVVAAAGIGIERVDRRARVQVGVARQKIEHLICGAERVGNVREHVGQRIERVGQGLRQEHEGHESAGLQRAVRDEPSAVVEHETRHEVWKARVEGLPRRIRERLALPDGHVLPQRGREVDGDGRLARHRAHGEHRRERLLGDLHRGRQFVLHRLGERPDVLAVPLGGDADDRHAGARDERERLRRVYHERERCDQLDSCPSEDVHVERDLVADLGRVGREPRVQVARRRPVVEAELQSEQVSEQPIADPHVDAHADQREQPAAAARRHGADRSDGGELRDAPSELLAVAMIDQIIQSVTRPQRDGRRRQCGDDGAAHCEAEQAQIRPRDGRDARDRRAPLRLRRRCGLLLRLLLPLLLR